MKTKFTPGYWVEENDSIISNEENLIGNIICDKPIGVPESLSYWEANKKLICAAPDLFKALTLLLDEFESDIEDAMHLTADNIPAIVYAKAAIKKATE